jgi:hypothetical protein
MNNIIRRSFLKTMAFVPFLSVPKLKAIESDNWHKIPFGKSMICLESNNSIIMVDFPKESKYQGWYDGHELLYFSSEDQDCLFGFCPKRGLSGEFGGTCDWRFLNNGYAVFIKDTMQFSVYIDSMS